MILVKYPDDTTNVDNKENTVASGEQEKYNLFFEGNKLEYMS